MFLKHPQLLFGLLELNLDMNYYYYIQSCPSLKFHNDIVSIYLGDSQLEVMYRWVGRLFQIQPNHHFDCYYHRDLWLFGEVVRRSVKKKKNKDDGRHSRNRLKFEILGSNTLLVVLFFFCAIVQFTVFCFVQIIFQSSGSLIIILIYYFTFKSKHFTTHCNDNINN